MNIKNTTIYICIIIVFGTLLFRPPVARGECADAMAKVYDALVAAAQSVKNPNEAKDFLTRMYDILFNREIFPCDDNGNPIAIPTTDPNITSGPIPTIDPNAPTPPPGDGSLAFFCQTDPAVADKTSPYLNPSIMSYGCGPTSMAMIQCTKSGYDNNSRMSCPNLPVTFGDILQKRTCAGGPCYGANGVTFYNEAGTNSPGVVNVLKEMGRQVEIIPANLAEWEKKTSAGYLLLTYSPDTPCAEGCAAPENRKLAHVFVVDYVDLKTGGVRLRDPINCGYSETGGGRTLYPISTQTTYAKGPQNFQIKVAFAIK